MKVGVIGLGTMGDGGRAQPGPKGSPGQRLRLSAPSGATREALAEQPAARRSAAPPICRHDLEAVLVFVVNAAQADDVLFGPEGCAAQLAKGTVVVCSTTVAPEAARALDNEARARPGC